MKAAVAEHGTVVWSDRPIPEPKPGEVRIRVAASAVNRADLVQVAGRYNPPPGATDVLGLECAGTIDAVGEGVDRQIGERVAALLVGGGYAEYVCCPAAHLLDVPEGVDLTYAASLPEVWVTAWLNLIHEGDVTTGERVVLHAGASGVGTAGIQLVTGVGGRAWVVVGSQDKIDTCVGLGADGGTNRHTGSWVDDVRAWAKGGANLILDPVGADTVPDGITVMAKRGRLVLIGLLSGRTAEIALGPLLVKRLRLQGSVLRGRSVAEKTELLAPFRTDVWPRLMSGELTGITDSVWAMQDVAKAHERLKTNETVGKLVLSWSA